jgi:hypothetical protein
MTTTQKAQNADLVEARIVMAPGVPPLGTPAFTDYLHRWHAEHNPGGARKRQAAQVWVPVFGLVDGIVLTDKGRDALQSEQPEPAGVAA